MEKGLFLNEGFPLGTLQTGLLGLKLAQPVRGPYGKRSLEWEEWGEMLPCLPIARTLCAGTGEHALSEHRDNSMEMEVTTALVGRKLQQFNALKLRGTTSPLPQSPGRIHS